MCNYIEYDCVYVSKDTLIKTEIEALFSSYNLSKKWVFYINVTVPRDSKG